MVGLSTRFLAAGVDAAWVAPAAVISMRPLNTAPSTKPDSGREDVADDAAGLVDDDRLDAVQVAFDAAVDHDYAGVNVSYHGTIRADRDALSVVDRAFDPALQNEVFFRAQLTFEAQRRAEHGDLAFRRRRLGRRLGGGAEGEGECDV